MQRPAKLASPRGKPGVLTPGMGAVNTTFMPDVELVRKGTALPVGSLTQMGTIRLGKRTQGRTLKIHDFVPLANLNDIVFGAWDLFPDAAHEAGTQDFQQDGIKSQESCLPKCILAPPLLPLRDGWARSIRMPSSPPIT
jgi:hypothetical protein